MVGPEFQIKRQNDFGKENQGQTMNIDTLNATLVSADLDSAKRALRNLEVLSASLNQRLELTRQQVDQVLKSNSHADSGLIQKLSDLVAVEKGIALLPDMIERQKATVKAMNDRASAHRSGREPDEVLTPEQFRERVDAAHRRLNEAEAKARFQPHRANT